MTARDACRAVRGLLFAYCDSELTPVQREQVDEHVTACRSCGMELSRCELELMRLREVLVPMEPTAQFTQNVMESVREIVAREAAHAPPQGFTRKVMDRVREEAGVSPTPSRLGRWGLRSWSARPHAGPHAGAHAGAHAGGRRPLGARVLIAAAAVLLAVISVVIALRNPAGETGAVRADWIVASVVGSDGLGSDVLGSDVLGSDAAGIVQAGNVLDVQHRFHWDDELVVVEARSAGSGDGRWRIEFRGRTQVEFVARGHLRVDEGDVRLVRMEGSAPILLEGPSGEFLRMTGSARDPESTEPGAGDFDVEIDRVEHESGALAATGLRRVRLRVREGRVSLRQSALADPVVVDAGFQAWLEPLRPLRIEPLHGRALRERPVAASKPVRPARELHIRGYVTDVERNGVGGARVTLHVHGRGPTEVLARADGLFDLRAELPRMTRETPEREMWLSARADDRDDLAMVPFHPLTRRPEAGEVLFESVQLTRSQKFRGRVVAAAGAPVRDARVRVLRYDSFFGRARFLTQSDAHTDGAGRFRLSRLVRERRGETTVLLIEPKGAPPYAAYGLLSGVLAQGGGEHVVRVSAPRQVELRVLDSGSRFVWVERRPAGPAGRFYRNVEKLALAPSARTLHVEIGAGERVRWWEDRGTGSPVLGHEAKIAQIPTGSASEQGVALLEQPFADLPPAATTPTAAGAEFVPLPGLTASLYGRFGPRRGSSRHRAARGLAQVSVHLLETSLARVAGAQVFVRVDDGPAYFVGWSDQDGAIDLGRLPVGSHVMALAVQERPAVGLGAHRFVVGATDSSQLITVSSTRGIRGRGLSALAGAAFANAFAELAVVSGPFQGFTTGVSIGADGSLDAVDVPPGKVQVRVGNRRVEVDNRYGEVELPDPKEWGR